jgi:hypothetical protein
MKYNCKCIINIQTLANKTSQKLYGILKKVRNIWRHSLLGRRLPSTSNFVLNPGKWQHPDREYFQRELQICKKNTTVGSYRTVSLKTKLKFWKLRRCLRYALSHRYIKDTARTFMTPSGLVNDTKILPGLATDTNKDILRFNNGYK